MKHLYDINSAARLLGISPWTVRAYIRRGKLKPVRFGRRVLLEETELERLVAENRTVSLPRPQPETVGEGDADGQVDRSAHPATSPDEPQPSVPFVEPGNRTGVQKEVHA